MSDNQILSNCVFCKKKLESKKPNANFCSDACRYQFANSKKVLFNHKCFECLKAFKSQSEISRFCSNECRWRNHRKKQTRDNAHKKINEIDLIAIANEKKQDVDFIKRLHASCMMVGFDFDLALRRYCDNDKSITIPSTLIDAHNKLMDEHFRSGRKN